MKKAFLFSMLLLITCVAASAQQVYNYKYLFHVNTDGVKVKIPGFEPGYITYFTFNSNMTKCYLCDKDGVVPASTTPYTYMGEQNNIYVYKQVPSSQAEQIALNIIGGNSELYFSKDFKRLNWKNYTINWSLGVDSKSDPGVCVYEYTSNPNPEQKSAPSTLY